MIALRPVGESEGTSFSRRCSNPANFQTTFTSFVRGFLGSGLRGFRLEASVLIRIHQLGEIVEWVSSSATA